MVSGHGRLTGVEVAGVTPFPAPQQAGDRWTDLLFRDKGLPGRRDVTINVGRQVTVDLRLTLPSSDPLIRRVGAGAARQDSGILASLAIADVGLQSEDGNAFVEWTAPTLQRARGREATIHLSGRSTDTPPGAVTVHVQSLSGCAASRCPVSVAVTAADRTITAVSPQRDVERQGRSSVSATIRDEPLVVRVDHAQPAGGSVEIAPVPTEVVEWATAVWRPLWVLLPWHLLVNWLGRVVDPPGANRRLMLGGYESTMVSLLAAGALAIFGISAGYVDRAYRALRGQIGDLERAGIVESLPGWLPQWLPSGPASTVPAAAAAFAIWAFRSRERLPGTSPTTTVMLHAAALGLGAGVVVAVVAVQATAAREGSDVAGQALWAGLAVTVAGCLLLSMAISPAARAMPAGLAAAALQAAIALADGTLVPRAAWLAGMLAVLCAVAFVATLAWTSASGSGSSGAQRLRTRTLARFGVVLLAALVVIPTRRLYAALAPVDPYDVVSVAFTTGTLVRLGLVITAAGLLWALSQRADVPPHVVRLLALGAMLALLLRSDVLYRGVPVSFLAGAVLVVALLVTSGQDAASWPLSPPAGRGGSVQIRSLLVDSAKSRSDRDLRASLRRKVAAAELDPADATAIQRAVSTAFGAPAHAPTATLRRNAVGWAGTPDPWRRGLIGASAAAMLGALLSGPTLGATVSELTTLRGPGPSSTLLTALLTFRYPIYGFLFGYFLPLLRGATGLGKATRLFVVLVVSEAFVLLLPFTGAEQFLQAVTLRALQLAMLSGVLGVGADLLALRTVGAGPADLLDLYHTNRLVLWSSGIAVTAATAVATALVGSAATLLVDRILPDETPPPAPTLSTTANDEAANPR